MVILARMPTTQSKDRTPGKKRESQPRTKRESQLCNPIEELVHSSVMTGRFGLRS
jgi:hypothetical protein